MQIDTQAGHDMFNCRVVRARSSSIRCDNVGRGLIPLLLCSPIFYSLRDPLRWPILLKSFKYLVRKIAQTPRCTWPVCYLFATRMCVVSISCIAISKFPKITGTPKIENSITYTYPILLHKTDELESLYSERIMPLMLALFCWPLFIVY